MADGGNVEFVEIDGLVVKLKLAGACGSCPSSLTTMTMGIKRRLMEKIPVSTPAAPAPAAHSCCAAHCALLLLLLLLLCLAAAAAAAAAAAVPRRAN
jgi:NifU-like domain